MGNLVAVDTPRRTYCSRTSYSPLDLTACRPISSAGAVKWRPDLRVRGTGPRSGDTLARSCHQWSLQQGGGQIGPQTLLKTRKTAEPASEIAIQNSAIEKMLMDELFIDRGRYNLLPEPRCQYAYVDSPAVAISQGGVRIGASHIQVQHLEAMKPRRERF